jgi:pSer/pThr/pTyr-binding forkhead associated (FHA) protein
VLDDGSIFTIDKDYVIGRDPSRDQDVQSGAARPMRIDDPHGQLSRVHLRIHLEGWQVEVVDLGSANGTGVWRPGDTQWTRVPPQTRIPIRPGTQVGFGRNQLRFESHTNT